MRYLDDLLGAVALWLLRFLIFVYYSLNLANLVRYYRDGIYRTTLVASHLLIILAMAFAGMADLGIYPISLDTRRLMISVGMVGIAFAGRKMLKNHLDQRKCHDSTPDPPHPVGGLQRAAGCADDYADGHATNTGDCPGPLES